jgi:hypothetical protein
MSYDIVNFIQNRMGIQSHKSATLLCFAILLLTTVLMNAVINSYILHTAAVTFAFIFLLTLCMREDDDYDYDVD